jgi:membrane protease YdiL (CAAX protease family)
MMASLSRIRLLIFDPGVEPFIVTGGIYVFTALYYTRLPVLQGFSFILLILVTVYWSRTIRREPRMTWRDLKLTRRHFGRNILLAMGLAIFGWFYYRLYVYLTRGVVIQLGYGGSPSAIMAIILVALAEEIYFRGYLQNRLNLRFGLLARVLLAVAALAFYKNVVHMWEGLPLVLQAELFLVGILHNVLPSLWMEWSDNLVGPLFLHIFWDLLVYAPLSGIPYWVI